MWMGFQCGFTRWGHSQSARKQPRRRQTEEIFSSVAIAYAVEALADQLRKIALAHSAHSYESRACNKYISYQTIMFSLAAITCHLISQSLLQAATMEARHRERPARLAGIMQFTN